MADAHDANHSNDPSPAPRPRLPDGVIGRLTYVPSAHGQGVGELRKNRAGVQSEFRLQKPSNSCSSLT